MTRNQLDEEVDKWHSIVSEVVGKHSKTVLVRPKDPIVNQWHTEELRQERKGIRDLCRKAEASRSTEDWDAFRDARREYTKNVRRAARDCYRKFATDLPDLKAMALFNKMTQAVRCGRDEEERGGVHHLD